ncbi:K02A2.6-like [Cordylochernes scorpioides]|uniref:K02A2.6-like n=1 Tax=Cordylochernes scorpioides TaxID=51811 RepID=A0ABY6L2B2_9ARAC|nr:K02A2.6-like [Cordylochernes scorpioides]
MVVGGEGPSLCGRNWMETLGILPTQPYKVDMIKEKISRELDILVKAMILKPVRHAEWATPIVPVLKSDQTIQICGDFKITANQAIKVDQYPHKAEDIFAALAGGEKFSKIDLRDAYNQLELDDPALFQKQMDMLLKGNTMVFCALDVILITGKNDQDYLKNLECILQRIQEARLELRKDKGSFLAPSLEVHIDHLGPFEQNLYLIVMDACTKRIEAIPVPNTSTREIIEQLCCLFARFGIPRTLVSDNAESAVQTIKTGLKKVQQGSISQRLAEILLDYKRTPIASIVKSPSEMMFGHNIRSHLDLILPNPSKSEEPGLVVKLVFFLKMEILTPTMGLWLAHRHAGVWLGTDEVMSTTIGQWLYYREGASESILD